MSGNWSHGLFGCLSEPSTCCMTLCCPCIVAGKIIIFGRFIKYVIGQNAEAAGQGSCLVYGCLVFIPFLGTYLVAKNREMIREQRGIEVTSYFGHKFKVRKIYYISSHP